MYINIVRDLWIDLRDRLSQGNTPTQFELELQKEISHLSQGSLSVSSYFTKFKTLWDEFVNYQPSLYALVLVQVDLRLLNWMHSIKSMFFVF